MARFGPQFWWPAKTKFEVVVGAILTQNTNWKNVEKALVNLERSGVLTPLAIRDISPKHLAALIKPAGFFNVKTKRLKSFIDFLWQKYDGSLQRMEKVPLEQLRPQLLAVNGIGPETADSILLYALEKPIFVVDAYTKRILVRHSLVSPTEDYHGIQKEFMRHLKTDPPLFNEYHALIVRVGKEFCRSNPLCEQCPLNDINYSITQIRKFI